MIGRKEDAVVKMTITRGDGRIENYDVFVAVVADRLMADGIEDGRPVYSAMEEGFSTQGFSCIAATAPVVAGLINALEEVVTSIIESLDAPFLVEILQATQELGSRKTDLYIDTKMIMRKIGDN